MLATGTNVVDLAAARARGIPVTNVPTYGTKSVAQMTFALLLELAHHTGHHAQTVREGRWTRNADWCYWDFPLVELDGLTLGMVGLGRIGRAVSELATAFGMKVVAYDPMAGPAPAFVRLVELDALFRESDVVSLHCPLTPQTANLVNASRLALMKPTAFLLNTSRGPLVDQSALAEALNSGSIAGAAMDVLAKEPPPADNPLLTAKNCILTPHLAWATRAARSPPDEDRGRERPRLPARQATKRGELKNHEPAIYPPFHCHHCRRIEPRPDSGDIRGATQADDHRVAARRVVDGAARRA